MTGVKTFSILLGCRHCLQHPIYGFSYMDTETCEFSVLLWKMEVFKERFLDLPFTLRQASLSSVVNSFGLLVLSSQNSEMSSGFTKSEGICCLVGVWVFVCLFAFSPLFHLNV